jgi:hypothetical protein
LKVLSFNGSVHRLDWIEGSDIGAKFISHMPAEQKKPKTVAATLSAHGCHKLLATVR